MRPDEPTPPDTPPEGEARPKAARGLMRTRSAEPPADAAPADATPEPPAPSDTASADAQQGGEPRRAAQRGDTPARREAAAAARATGAARPPRPTGEAAKAAPGQRTTLALPPPADPAKAQAPARPTKGGGADAPARAQLPAKAQLPAGTGQAKPAPAKPGAKASPRDARPPRRTVSRTAPMSLAAIHAAMAGHQEGHDPVRLAIDVVVKIASVVWLAGAVIVWIRLLGYSEDALVASWHEPGGPWISTAIAAVTMPVISVGLWLSASWGVVLWSSAVLAAIISTIVNPQAVPFGMLALVANVAGLALACGLAAVKGWSQRSRNR
ncbi:hypothetical protein [Acuticoccus sp. I52.16.1]|uniref:hypothetical protein n=1 Tax=Acuticoccus sp. I52.16.1 TaxID=2928472 RepID=UPI001FD5CBE4|nr:hypothetical protein [Acuticoccus sp. I52.16.1]UOM33785.1 hypothetical protein MRB58_18405 [Acuticoccus sp. I52.16.1]